MAPHPDRLRGFASVVLLVLVAIGLRPLPALAQTTVDPHVIAGGGGSGVGGTLELQGTIGQAMASAPLEALSGLTSGFWAVVAPPICLLDVDADGSVQPTTDITYIARHLLGLVAVPPSFRVTDPTIPPDAEIVRRIDAAGVAFNVDERVGVAVPTDITYIARQYLVLSPVPPSFRINDPTIPANSVIGDAIIALCPP